MNTSAFNTVPFNGGPLVALTPSPLPDVRGTLLETAPAFVVDFVPDVFVLFEHADESEGPRLTVHFNDS